MTSGRRVVLTHPYFWPHVRRGAEREVHDTAVGLLERGWDPHIVTSQPGGTIARRRIDEIPVTYVRLIRPKALARRRVTEAVAFGGAMLAALPMVRADLVHAFHYADAWAATRTRRLRRRPVVLKLTGTVLPERMQHVRYDRRVFREALEAADAVWCNSNYAAEVMAPFGRDIDVVPAGVDLDRFHVAQATHDPPVVLCASAPTDPRKRLSDLVDAWPLIKDAVPDARLALAGEAPADAARDLLDRVPAALRDSVDLVGDLRDDALVRAYQNASCVVAPAPYEALGLTTLEALACGTPVAGARSGATIELVSESVGDLFEPFDAADCARSVVRGIELSQSPEVRARCRAAAEPYGWDRILDEIERRYDELIV